MPQSLSTVYVHLVFSTKGRVPFFRDLALREELHAYLGGVSRELDCPPVIIGGVSDHVHLLCRLGRTISQADWVKELKRISTLWLKQKDRSMALEDFAWQGGYAVFSVSQSNLEAVKQYVVRQEEHHHKMTFQDELRALLEKHTSDFDERYVWD